MITLVPPGGDLTLRLVADEVLDANRRFVTDLVAAAGARTLPTTGQDGTATLMLGAGRQVLADTSASTVHRLRGLGAVLVGLQRDDHGVRLGLDDLHLTSGTTEHSQQVLAAAELPAPYSETLRATCAEVPPGQPVRLVVERDQQLPAALTAARLLCQSGSTVEVTGRFATACWPVLRTLSPFRGATMAATPRGLTWEVTSPFGGGTHPAPRWRERASDPVPDSPWAGRVALRELDDLDAAPAPHTVILGVCADAHRAVGRGGHILRWADLAAAVTRLRRRATTVLAELWVGAPGIDPAQAPAAAQTLGGIVDRVAGLRIFDWPVHWTEPAWAGQPVRVEPVRADLARHARLLSPQPPDPDELRSVIAAVARPLAVTGSLVPGRLAGAYLLPPAVSLAEPLTLDPDAVLGWRSRGGARAVAVNVRTGVCTRVSGAVADLIRRRAGGAELQTVVRQLPPDEVRALRDGHVLVERS